MTGQAARKVSSLPAAETLAEAIRGRRSVREFLPDPIPRRVLEEVVELALWAPSAYNRQDWRFVVATGEAKDRCIEALGRKSPHFASKVRELFSKRMAVQLEGFFNTMGQAPVVVFAYGEAVCGQGGEGESDEAGYASACAAVQNLLLSAHAKGLGGCWVQAFREVQEEVDEILGVAGRPLVAGIPLGYPAGHNSAPPRKPGRVTWLGFA